MQCDEFHIRDLAILSYAQGFTMWHYRHPTPNTVWDRPGFFADAAEMFAEGDMLTISFPGGGAVRFVRRVTHYSPFVILSSAH